MRADSAEKNQGFVESDLIALKITVSALLLVQAITRRAEIDSVP